MAASAPPFSGSYVVLLLIDRPAVESWSCGDIEPAPGLPVDVINCEASYHRLCAVDRLPGGVRSTDFAAAIGRISRSRPCQEPLPASHDAYPDGAIPLCMTAAHVTVAISLAGDPIRPKSYGARITIPPPRSRDTYKTEATALLFPREQRKKSLIGPVFDDASKTTPNGCLDRQD
jgi:hypothetical protein